MSKFGDHELEGLLVETFRAHEHLADPTRATAIAARSPRGRHPGRVVLGAAAAVALVAGTAYGITRGGGTTGPTTGPTGQSTPPGGSGSHTPVPPLPRLQSDSENRALAVSAAAQVAGRLTVFPGARRSGRIALLDRMGLMTSGPPHNTVTDTRWWTVPGGDPRAVAQWYAAHPPRSLRAEGGVSSMSSSGPGRPDTTVYAADYSQPGPDVLPPHGVSAEIETTAAPGGTAVRATVMSIWEPARPLASYVQDVRSIDVLVVKTRFGVRAQHERRTFSITDPARVLGIATAFDSLPGYPGFEHGCPLLRNITEYRIVFHTDTGDLTAQYDADTCSSAMSVSRGGHQVGPGLGDVARLVALLGP